tara:strand:+ start:139 stop:516 length:378 start_codon:yes stop_codon:yes gene_type:complete
MDTRDENRKMVEDFRKLWKSGINESLKVDKTPKQTMNEAFESFNGFGNVGAVNNPFYVKPTETKKPIKEEYVESMNIPVLDTHLSGIAKLWKEWKNGPMTEAGDIKPAQKELLDYITQYLRKNIK